MQEEPHSQTHTLWEKNVGRGFIFFLGALRYYKGLSFLLEAAPFLKARIVIAGAGPEEATLIAHAKKLNAHNVLFLGKVSEDDKRSLFRLAGAFAFPAHLPSEAFGVALLEAAAYGLPLVSTDLETGTSYINQHNQTGFVVPSANAFALAQALNSLLENPLQAKKFGQNARKRYEELFRETTMCSRYAALYRKLLRC